VKTNPHLPASHSNAPPRPLHAQPCLKGMAVQRGRRTPEALPWSEAKRPGGRRSTAFGGATEMHCWPAKRRAPPRPDAPSPLLAASTDSGAHGPSAREVEPATHRAFPNRASPAAQTETAERERRDETTQPPRTPPPKAEASQHSAPCWPSMHHGAGLAWRSRPLRLWPWPRASCATDLQRRCRKPAQPGSAELNLASLRRLEFSQRPDTTPSAR